MVDWSVIIPPEREDPTLGERLRKEASGVLRWIVEGALAWQREGLRPPRSVIEATEAYRAEQDVLASFLEERCLVGEDLSVSSAQLYRAYVIWCEAEGERPTTERKPGGQLRERGFERDQASTKNKERISACACIDRASSGCSTGIRAEEILPVCLAIPACVEHVEGLRAMAEFGGVRREISLALCPRASVGQYVLVHAGFAITVIEEAEAVEGWALLSADARQLLPQGHVEYPPAAQSSLKGDESA